MSTPRKAFNSRSSTVGSSVSSSPSSCLPKNCELRLANFYIAILLEGLAVALLVFFGGTVFIKHEVAPHGRKKDFILEIAVVYGATIAALTQCLKNITGAHVNPAITVACLITRRVSLLRGFCYVFAQLGGSALGAVMLRFLVPKSRQRHHAMTKLSNDVTIVSGMVFEMLFTLIFSLLYFSSVSRARRQHSLKHRQVSARRSENGPLMLGVFYGVSHLVLVERTGCSMNPARSLGPAIVEKDFTDIWLYIAGPTLACCFGVLMYDLVLRKVEQTTYPRPRSLSLMCCKPSHEEIILQENQTCGYSEEYLRRKDEATV